MTLLLIVGVLVISLAVSSKLSDTIKGLRKEVDEVYLSIQAVNSRCDDMEKHKHLRGKVVLPDHD